MFNCSNFNWADSDMECHRACWETVNRGCGHCNCDIQGVTSNYFQAIPPEAILYLGLIILTAVALYFSIKNWKELYDKE